MKHEHVQAVGGRKSTGEPVMEELAVTPVGDSLLLLDTPVIVLGVAAGDTIQVDESGNVAVVQRGGNVGIQIYGGEAAAETLLNTLGPSSARIDARVGELAIVTVPVGLGFRAIEGALEEMTTAHPECRWYYANVYDEDGVTPLNWW